LSLRKLKIAAATCVYVNKLNLGTSGIQKFKMATGSFLWNIAMNFTKERQYPCA